MTGGVRSDSAVGAPEDRVDDPPADLACGDGAANDTALAVRSAAGDMDAFEELVRRYEGLVYRMTMRVLRSREDAEDACQEAFARAWKSVARYDAARPFRPWLLKIAANVALTQLSRRAACQPIADGADLEQYPDARRCSPSEAAAAREQVLAIRRAVAELPGDAAVMFHLRYTEEMPVSEVAAVLGRQPGAVAVALHRMREHIARMLHGGVK